MWKKELVKYSLQRQKTSGFLTYSEGIEREHWPEID